MVLQVLHGTAARGEKVDAADSRLESGAQSVRDSVWGTGADVKESYTIYLTPSAFDAHRGSEFDTLTETNKNEPHKYH